MASIAYHFEQQATAITEKNILKTPGWDRISIQAKTVVLRAMSTDTLFPQTDPTKEMSDLLQCKSAGSAHQFVGDYFDAHNRGKYAAISAGLTSALWACIIRGTSPGTPENLSVFFVPRRSPAGHAASINHLSNHLKTIDGTGLDAAEIKLATKQKIVLPTDLQEYIHQVSNFALIIGMIFGTASVIYKCFGKVVSHATKHETEYEDRQRSCQNFFAKLLSFFDRRIQNFLDDCSAATDFSTIDFTGLSFDSTLRDVVDGSFRVDLPIAIQSCLPAQLQTPTKSSAIAAAIVTPPMLKKQKTGGPPARGDPELNTSIYPSWKLQSGENYVNVFCKEIDRSKLPKIPICLNYHIRGSCHTLCDRVTSHSPAQTLDAATKKLVTEYIAAARLQYKEKHPS